MHTYIHYKFALKSPYTESKTHNAHTVIVHKMLKGHCQSYTYAAGRLTAETKCEQTSRSPCDWPQAVMDTNNLCVNSKEVCYDF